MLQQKDAQLKQKDTQLREQDAEPEKQDTLLQQKDAQLKQKDVVLQRKDEESDCRYAILLEEHQKSSRSLSAEQVSCSHLLVSFSSIKPYIITHYPFPSLNGLSYIVPPILTQSLGHCHWLVEL